jgi:ribosomal protein L4
MKLPRRCPICRATCDTVVDLSCLTYGKAAQYRDDSLMAIRGTPRQAEAKTKEVAKILKSTGINITIAGNLKVINFLDLTLDLTLGTYKTYNKPNNVPLYVHKQSSHPPNVTKNIPLAVNKRLSENSSTKE